MKKLMALGKSVCHALDGLWYCIQQERNFRIHICAALSVLLFSTLYGLKGWEWAAIVLAIWFVMTMELLNTSIEKTVDLITKERLPEAKTAKDTAAGMVLLSALGTVVLALIIFSDLVRWKVFFQMCAEYWFCFLPGAVIWLVAVIWFIFYFPEKGRSGDGCLH